MKLVVYVRQFGNLGAVGTPLDIHAMFLEFLVREDLLAAAVWVEIQPDTGSFAVFEDTLIGFASSGYQPVTTPCSFLCS